MRRTRCSRRCWRPGGPGHRRIRGRPRDAIALDPYVLPACGEPLDRQDLFVLDQLAGMGAYQVTAGSHDLLASGLTETDLDPRLLAHYRAWPDLVRLIVRDRSGEGTLIYAPLATDVPAPSEPPASMRGARQA